MSDESRIPVYDQLTRKIVHLDISDTEQWGPIEEHQDWSPDYGAFQWCVEETLYRHQSGHWTLVQDRMYCEADLSCGNEAKRLSDSEAVRWLRRHGFSFSFNPGHFEKDDMFQPGPPAFNTDDSSEANGSGADQASLGKYEPPEYLGNSRCRANNGTDEVVQLEHVENKVLEFLVKNRACNKPALEKVSVDSIGVLKRIKNKYKFLDTHIVFPGGKGRGGYKTTITAAPGVFED